MDALVDFPNTETLLETEKGTATFIKMDIFKGILWYAYNNSDDYKWYSLTYEQVNEIIALNRSGKKAVSLSDFEIVEVKVNNSGFENATGEDSLTRFDRPKNKKKKKRNNSKTSVESKNQNQTARPNTENQNSQKPVQNRGNNKNEKPVQNQNSNQKPIGNIEKSKNQNTNYQENNKNNKNKNFKRRFKSKNKPDNNRDNQNNKGNDKN